MDREERVNLWIEQIKSLARDMNISEREAGELIMEQFRNEAARIEAARAPAPDECDVDAT